MLRAKYRDVNRSEVGACTILYIVACTLTVSL